MDNLFNYFFLVVALGTGLLGIASGVIGTSIVLERQSQLGDAIGHAVYPGVIMAFMLFQTRDTLILLIGAAVLGIIAYLIINLIHKYSYFAYESILALVLSSFFSIGLLLYSIVQNNPDFQTVNYAGLDDFIMGQAAYLLTSDVYIIAFVSLLVLVIFFVYYPQIKQLLFDKVYAQSIGIKSDFISKLLLILCLLVIVVGLKAVGAKLISSMLIAPAVTALQWSNKYNHVLVISAAVGGVSAVLGSYLSTVIPNLATGPTIILILSACALLSILFAPGGFVTQESKKIKEVTY